MLMPSRSGWNGLQAWWGHWVIGEPRPVVSAPMDVTGKDAIPGFREQRRWDGLTLGAEDLGLSDGFTNHDALLALEAEIEAAGASLWTLYLPPSPEYAPRYLRAPLEETFHAFWGERLSHYRVMPTLPQDHYTDYRHLNNDGRALMTKVLVELLATAERGVPAQPPAELSPVPAADTRSLQRAQRPRKGRRDRRSRKASGF